MRILLDTSPLESGHKTRGIGRYTRELLRALKSQPDLILVDREHDQKPQLIHYPSFDLFQPTLWPLHSCPVAVTIHDVIPLRFPDHYPAGIKGRLALMWQKLALKKVKVILTDSHESRSDIYRLLKVDPGRVFVVPLGVSEVFNPLTKKASQPILAQYKINQPYILYVGDINYNKNLPELIAAFSQLPDAFQLVLVGHNFKPQTIPEWQAIDQAIQRHDLTNRVVMINNLDQSQIDSLRALYSQALCYVQVSLVEGFGLPVLEAMACGTLTLVSQTPALKEVGSSVAFYTSTDADSIASNIKKIMRLSPAKIKEKKREGLVWAKGFSWHKTARATALIYQKAINGEFD